MTRNASLRGLGPPGYLISCKLTTTKVEPAGDVGGQRMRGVAEGTPQTAQRPAAQGVNEWSGTLANGNLALQMHNIHTHSFDSRRILFPPQALERFSKVAH
mmetsp:Transcript_19821/g.32573  ORF Transcript_19821/g.32573 Transcript_19821/m.32573 type:complete len:101 (-) Transcript_19821:1887-2189(-)